VKVSRRRLSRRVDKSLSYRDYDRAISDYDQAIRLDPKNDSAYAARDAAYEAKNDPNLTIAAIDQALKFGPSLSTYRSGKFVVAHANSGRQKVIAPKLRGPIKRCPTALSNAGD
jgi:tetratricopeptide (TPR) repeat protein